MDGGKVMDGWRRKILLLLLLMQDVLSDGILPVLRWRWEKDS